MGDTDLETMANVTIAEYDYEDEAFDNISEDAKDFIDRLLVKEKEYVMLFSPILWTENDKKSQSSKAIHDQQVG